MVLGYIFANLLWGPRFRPFDLLEVPTNKSKNSPDVPSTKAGNCDHQRGHHVPMDTRESFSEQPTKWLR